MADVSPDTINRLWSYCHDYSWESLRQGLDLVLKDQVITRDMYTDLEWAINKLENMGEEFPATSSELYSIINPFM